MLNYIPINQPTLDQFGRASWTINQERRIG